MSYPFAHIMSTAIPVIDLAALYSASPSAQLEVAKEIYDAFHSWGFCTLVGHMSQSLFKKAYVLARPSSLHFPERRNENST